MVMAKETATPAASTEPEMGPALRRCIGSAKFGIEAHEAPVGDFPAQPSQKDGLGRMCKPHWNQYTKDLRKAALARKADGPAVTEEAPTESAPAVGATREADGGKTAKKARAAKPEPIRTRTPRRRQQPLPEAGSQGDAG
jgi:hypothetical protein